MSGLLEVPFDCFGAVGAVLGGVGKSEARPAGVVAGFDGGKPSGFDREACCGVEVVHEGAYAGEVACVECEVRSCGMGCREVGWLWMVVRQEREAPEFGAGGFAPPLEQDGVVLFVEDGDGVGVEEDAASVVAELADSKQVVLEGGHYLDVLDWE